MAKDKNLKEGFTSKKVSVVRKITQQAADGTPREKQQTVHTTNVQVGDKFLPPDQRDAKMAQHHQNKVDAGRPPKPVINPPPPPPPSPLEVDDEGHEVPPSGPAMRMSVAALEAPWLGEKKRKEDLNDPIPPEIRAKFGKKRQAPIQVNMSPTTITTTPVTAGDAVLWGVVEPDLIERLRIGRMIHIKMSPSFETNGVLFGKFEAPDGAVHPGVIKMEGLANSYFYDVWGELYLLKKEQADIPRREAATYEFSKVLGLDDMVPPTIVRREEPGSITPLLTQDLIEARTQYFESIAVRLGVSPDEAMKTLGGMASVHFLPKITNTVAGEAWFHSIFPAPDAEDKSTALNRLWELMPPGQRMGMLRTAILDFLFWVGDRSLCSVNFGEEAKHDVILLDNGLSFVDPKAVGERYAAMPREFTGGPIVPGDTYPLLWSEPCIFLAVRGSEVEVDDYAAAADIISGKATLERCMEGARSAIDYGVPKICVAGVLSRISMLNTHARYIARDPLLAARYYSALATGTPAEGTTPGSSILDEFAHVTEFVNKVMKRFSGKFDFAAEMAGQDEDES